MSRITGSYPDDLDLLIEGTVEAGVFSGKSDALREFARDYFDDNDEDRIAAAVALYERETITLGAAARLAGVNRFEMRDVLRDHGVELRLGLSDDDDAEYEIESSRELAYADSDDRGDDGSDAE